MLVLSRRIGDVVCIGDDITIHVVDIGPGKVVRLGIRAPRDVQIDRQEIRNVKKAADGIKTVWAEVPKEQP